MASIVRLTDRHLLRTVASFPLQIQQDPTSRTFYLSLAIAKYFFGREWLDDHIEDTGRPGYLRLNWRDRVQAEVQSFRLVDFAELLFNLQHVEGFDDCIKKMRAGDVEGTYAELDLGRMLYQSSVDFRFVITSGQKGDDFDIEIRLNDGTVVCADAKCKIESTDFSERTVLNSLHRARTQFPGRRPSIVFMKVPPRWLIEHDGPVGTVKVLLTNVANKFLRSTGRVVSVKYYVSLIHWEAGHVTHIQAFEEINNHNAANRFDPSRNWDMFEEANENITPNEGGEFSDVPERWRRLMYYPQGIPK
jgi:hypothetical protein